MGHIVLPYEPDYFATRGTVERLVTRMRRQPPPAKIRTVGEDLVGLCRRNQFDLVFVLAENFLGAETLREIRSNSKYPPTLVYHSHDNNFVPGILKPADFEDTLRSYDIVFTTKSQNVRRYTEQGVKEAIFLPSAFEPSIHHPIEDRYSRYSGRAFPVTFIGTYDRSRIPFVEQVGWDRLHVWGDRWNRYPQYRKVRQHIHPRAIYDFEFADVTSHTKCALGLLREEAEDLHTTRTFEIPACGALQIAPRNSEILSFFTEDEEIVCFDSLAEMTDKIDFYLRNDFKREQIARKGHERCLRDKHTYLDRAKEIIRKVEERNARNYATAFTRDEVSLSAS